MNEGLGDAIHTVTRWVADRRLGRCIMRRSSVLLSVVVLLSRAVVLARPPTAVLAVTPTSDLEANSVGA